MEPANQPPRMPTIGVCEGRALLKGKGLELPSGWSTASFDIFLWKETCAPEFVPFAPGGRDFYLKEAVDEILRKPPH